MGALRYLVAGLVAGGGIPLCLLCPTFWTGMASYGVILLVAVAVTLE